MIPLCRTSQHLFLPLQGPWDRVEMCEGPTGVWQCLFLLELCPQARLAEAKLPWELRLAGFPDSSSLLEIT